MHSGQNLSLARFFFCQPLQARLHARGGDSSAILRVNGLGGDKGMSIAALLQFFLRLGPGAGLPAIEHAVAGGEGKGEARLQPCPCATQRECSAQVERYRNQAEAYDIGAGRAAVVSEDVAGDATEQSLNWDGPPPAKDPKKQSQQ